MGKALIDGGNPVGPSSTVRGSGTVVKDGGPLLAAGCRIGTHPAPFDHSKLMTIDGIWSLIGSSNDEAERYYERALAKLHGGAAGRRATFQPDRACLVDARSGACKGGLDR